MKYLFFPLIASVLVFGSVYKGSTKASVTLAGGIIKAKHVEENGKKYKRKDCPVCKGKGKYLSGDGIKWVDCGYCEPDSGSVSVTHPPIIIKQNCPNGVCPINKSPKPNNK